MGSASARANSAAAVAGVSEKTSPNAICSVQLLRCSTQVHTTACKGLQFAGCIYVCVCVAPALNLAPRGSRAAGLLQTSRNGHASRNVTSQA